MCHYNDVFGSGDALALQLLTLLSIASSIVFWVFAYRREKVGLKQYVIPIVLWVVFGTLDIMITARGTITDPMREGNPLARFIFVETGWVGPVVASILWIALWAGIVLAVNKKLSAPLATFISLAVFYSLAIGHVFGFSSWFIPFCDVSIAYRGTLAFIPNFIKIIALGCLAAALHFLIVKSINGGLISK
ncbi:MAG: hypothetical protein V1861_02150 [Candidatus Micrarchaeota archaeon]